MDFILINERKAVTGCIVFVMTCLLSMTSLNVTSLVFVLPLLIVVYVTGIFNTFMYMSAVLLVSYIQKDIFLCTVVMVSVTVVYLLAFCKILKVEYLPHLLTLILIPFLYVNHNSFEQIVFLVLLHLLNASIYQEIIPLFIHQNLDILTNKRLCVVVFIVCTMILSFVSVNTTYMIILIRYFLLFAIFYLSIHSIMPVVVYIAILMLFISPELKDDVLAILIPTSFFFIIQPRNKYLYASVYLLAHIILPFFITIQYEYYCFVVLVPCFMFVISPQVKRKKQLLFDDYKQVSANIKLKEKADSFSRLFKKIVEIFQQEYVKTNLSEYVGFVYEDVCMKCQNRNACFHDCGISNLGKMIQKSLDGQMKQGDYEYINNYCLKAEEYLSSIENHKKGYERMTRVAQANNHMKKNLLHEFSVISHLFENYFQENTMHTEKQIKKHLEAYRFSMYYIKQIAHDYRSFTLELGLKNCTLQEVEEELIPILETYIGNRLKLTSYKKVKGYLACILKHELIYSIQVSVKQSALKDICGDSFTSFSYKQHQYVVLCDGMGQGREAHEESKLTLDILTQMITNNINLKDTLSTLNALFRVKNQGDMYSTLDLFDFNLNNNKLKIIKYGACQSYMLTNQRVDIISAPSLPVGFQKNMKMKSFDIVLKPDDMFVMVSDGISDNLKSILEMHRDELIAMSERQVANYLYQHIKKEISDDATLVVMKVAKTA